MSKTFVGQPGNNTFIGDPGTNTLDYSVSPGATNVDLAADTAVNGYGGTDTVGNIQIVLGSAQGGTFVGGSGAESYVVSGGNNVISGTPPTIVEFAMVPTPGAEPFMIKAGPDGNVWFSETDANKIARIDLDGTLLPEFDTPASAINQGIPGAPHNTSGFAFEPSTGNIWFPEVGSDKIGVMSPSGVLLHEYDIPSPLALVHTITLGPDGNFWFAEVGTDKIGRITPAGVVTEFKLPTADTRGPATDFSAGSQPFDIIVGPDGALWFTEFTGDRIGRITTDGDLSEFNVPIHTSGIPGFVHLGDPLEIIVGPDGALWYSDLDGNSINRITTTGEVNEYPVPTLEAQVQGLVAAPDGTIWFIEQQVGKIGRITLDGQITEFAIPGADGPGSFPFDITVGPDGHLWFTEILDHRVGRITIGSELTVDYSHALGTVIVDLKTGSVENGFGGTDTLADVQSIIGSPGADIFVSGGPQAAIGEHVALAGGNGADTFVFTAGAVAQGQSGLFNTVTDYTLVDGDQLDVSAIVSAAFNHGTGQAIASLVRVVEDASGAFARLQVDQDGAANGTDFVTIAQLDGVHVSDSVNVIVDGAQPAGASVAVAGKTSWNDLDGNGSSDILWRSDNGPVTISFLVNGQPEGTRALPGVSADWHATGVGDFNGDGTGDVLWHDDNGQNSIVLLSNGRFLSGLELASTSAEWRVTGNGDFNGDGTDDILWHNDLTGQNSVELLKNGSFLAGVQLPETSSEWQVAGVGDFNGDRTDDILWYDKDNGQNYVELLSSGRFESRVQLSTASLDWHVAGIGDFNGDGTSDILWHNDKGWNVVELLDNGHFLSGVQLNGTTSEWHLADIGDYNGDGTSDILWLRDGGQSVVELLKNGQFQLGVLLPDAAAGAHVVSHFGGLL